MKPLESFLFFKKRNLTVQHIAYWVFSIIINNIVLFVVVLEVASFSLFF